MWSELGGNKDVNMLAEYVYLVTEYRFQNGQVGFL